VNNQFEPDRVDTAEKAERWVKREAQMVTAEGRLVALAL
jgi:hypothetical protein